jgi:hypothetical protein
MSDGGKGSSPRPFSVSQEEFNNRWDNIFKKDKDMQIRVKEDVEDIGRCGCGRSPTGKCIGWHGLSEEMYQHQKMLWLEDQLREDSELEEYQKQAQEIWNDSCTAPRKEQ